MVDYAPDDAQGEMYLGQLWNYTKWKEIKVNDGKRIIRKEEGEGMMGYK